MLKGNNSIAFVQIPYTIIQIYTYTHAYCTVLAGWLSGGWWQLSKQLYTRVIHLISLGHSQLFTNI